MKKIKRALANLLIRLLDRLHRPNYYLTKKDEQKIRQWLLSQYQNDGWKAYFGREDYRLLKMLGQLYDRDDHLTLIGRRMMLLQIAQDMHNEYQNQVKEQKREVVKEANRPPANY